MDIPRDTKSNKNRRWLYLGGGVTAVVVITVALGRLGPASLIL